MGSETDAIKTTEDAQQTNEENKEEKLNELLASGRRFLKLGEYEKATEVLSDAAELSNELYGDNHENTFDSIYYYAIATFEFAKKESQLLANRNPQETEEAEDGNEEEESKKTTIGEVGDNDPAEEEKEDGEEDDEAEEDDDSMKLAWELLEMARCIAEAKVEQLEHENGLAEQITEWQLKKADVLVLLGEHGIADGKYTDAQGDLVRALEIQKVYLPPSSRCIAQTYMLVGNACGLDARYDESISYLQKTEATLVSRSQELEARLKEVDDEETKAGIEEELKELSAMKPEISTMIADAVTSAAQAEEVKKQMKAQFEGLTSALAQLPQQNVEAQDITSLVRRPAKRMPGDCDEMPEHKKQLKDN